MGQRVTQKQLRAIPFLLSSFTVTEGCRAAGITRKTYYEWIKEPGFKAEMEKKTDSMVNSAIGDLKTASISAIKTLKALLQSEDESIQLRTSQALLDFMLKFSELDEVLKRIKAVEDVVNG